MHVKSYKLTLPDQATLKLADGEHAIGSLQTEHGSLEARVTVAGKDISAPRFLIGGGPCEKSQAAPQESSRLSEEGVGGTAEARNQPCESHSFRTRLDRCSGPGSQCVSYDRLRLVLYGTLLQGRE